MEWADLLPIGRFSQLSRLSLKALRLYDQMGLMRPAYVDPESGYRYYSMSQAREAQLIRLLRRLDMPLSDIRQVLGTSDPHKRAALLDTYWSGVEARVVEGRQTVTRLHQLLNRRLLTMQESSLPGVPLLTRGKVRDMYDLGDQLLIVVSDRISAFDVVLPTAIPGKGKVLNQLSTYWFEQTQNILPNHVLTTDVDAYPSELRAHAAQLAGRSMLVRRAERVDIECVARGYITGSGWAEYQRSGTICGLRLPEGLIEAQQLPEPIFTPTTKAETGHDEPLTFEQVETLVGRPLAAQLRDATLAVYSAAAEQARQRGIIIADTKMEFGIIRDNGADEGELILIDELLTPDSSRFWDTETYEPGSNPPSYDKQYVRDYLDSTGWDKEPPAPPLPSEVVARTQEKYADALRLCPH